MNAVIKFIATLLLIGGIYKYNLAQEQTDFAAAAAIPFVELPIVTDNNHQSVLVIAAENCSGKDAKRADSLAKSLAENGIPVSRIHSFRLEPQDAAAVDRINAFDMNKLPIVFVRGKAKSNPNLEEVIAEYKAAR